MSMRVTLIVACLAAAVAFAIAIGAGRTPTLQYTSDVGIAHAGPLVPTGGNLYFSIEPGTFHRYEGIVDGEFVEVEQTVLKEVRSIDFTYEGKAMNAMARVIEEREWVDGELAEISHGYYARGAANNNIYFFGEDIWEYEDGELVSREGTWLAGKGGAQPGLAMPATYLVGARYYTSQAPGVSMDRADHLTMGMTISVPYSAFDDTIIIMETSELDDGKGDDEETLKVYEAGIGMVADGELRLVDYRGG